MKIALFHIMLNDKFDILFDDIIAHNILSEKSMALYKIYTLRYISFSWPKILVIKEAFHLK